MVFWLHRTTRQNSSISWGMVHVLHWWEGRLTQIFILCQKHRSYSYLSNTDLSALKLCMVNNSCILIILFFPTHLHRTCLRVINLPPLVLPRRFKLPINEECRLEENSISCVQSVSVGLLSLWSLHVATTHIFTIYASKYRLWNSMNIPNRRLCFIKYILCTLKVVHHVSGLGWGCPRMIIVIIVISPTLFTFSFNVTNAFYRIISLARVS